MRSLVAALVAVLVLLGPAPARAAEAVGNGSAAIDLTGWVARSHAGTVTVRRVTGLAGAPAGTGVEVRREGGSGSWAYALSALRTPTFTVGGTYRMTAWVRDLGGAGRTYGILLANGYYEHRPTATAEYVRPTGTGWTRVTRTFVATAPGAADTAFYLTLPPSGSFALQVTGLSVQPATAYAPARIRTAPARTITFDGPAGSSPDAAVWNLQTGAGGWGNGERQTYTADTANAQLDGSGHLRITALRTGGGFTSARLNTQDKVVVAPGSYVEATLTAPTGAGVWPAFWLLGAAMPAVGWPACGELDVFEGTGAQPTLAKSAAHMALAGDPRTDRQYGWGEAGGTTDLGEPTDTAGHRYGVYFDARTVRFYVDRRLTMSLWASDALASGRTWPFGKPHFLLLNVAVAGGVDTSGTTFPRTMTVGPVSVWKGGVPV